MSDLINFTRNRKHSGKLSEIQRQIIIDRCARGEKHAEIAASLGIARSTIARTLQRWQRHRTAASLPRSGRPKALDEREIH